MRLKVLIAVVLCGVLLAPATASARKAVYSGNLNGGGTISITAKQKGKRGPIRIGSIRLRDVPATCGDQTIPLGYTTSGTFGLGRDREFDFKITDRAGAKLQIAAKLSRRAKSFNGFARLYGTFPSPSGPLEDCDSGQDGFIAKP